MKTPAQKATLYYRSIALLHYAKALQAACHGTRDYVGKLHGTCSPPNRFPVSGGICNHWPETSKNAISDLSREGSKVLDESLDCWRAAGRRRDTWLDMKTEVLGPEITTF